MHPAGFRYLIGVHYLVDIPVEGQGVGYTAFCPALLLYGFHNELEEELTDDDTIAPRRAVKAAVSSEE